jgi:hypothetical protein
MQRYRHLLTGALLLLATASPVAAGGPLDIFDPATQQPFFYADSLRVYTDNDPWFSLTGPVSSAGAAARTAFGIAQWTDVATSSFAGFVAGDFASIGLPDITLDNVGLVLGVFNGGGYHVIYDHDGSIIAALAGPGVLGFSGPEFSTTGTPLLTESVAVLNGSEVSVGDAEGIWYQAVFTHEFGHGINLAHVQTNGSVTFFNDDRGPAACPTPYGGFPGLPDVETMYPFIDPRIGRSGIEQGTVDLLDDRASVSDLYPGEGWSDQFGSIEGTVYRNNGVTPVTGVNVIVRNVADPWDDCISMLSGAFSQGLAGPDGRFRFNGLTPGAQYVVYVDVIVAGGFSTPQAIPLPGPEEYWNGADENGNPDIDPACEFEMITAEAGARSNADIVLNFGLILGDDDFVEVRLPFPFVFCKREWTRVFVGSNGYLTFGRGDVDFSPSLSDFLDGAARIAPLWTDLNPVRGGSITVTERPDSWKVQYTNIPDFSGAGVNTFSVTLRLDGTFAIEYGNMTAKDGLAGRTEGGGVPDPGETDLGAAPQPIAAGAGTVYEIFSGDNDLANAQIEYGSCSPFVFVFGPAEPGVLYASTGAGGATRGSLLAIDPATGAGTLVGRTGRERVPGLAITSTRALWGSSGGGASQLLRVSASDAVTQVVGTIRNAATGQSLPFVDALAFDGSDALYGIDVTNNLWKIDTSTALAARIGFTGVSPDPFLVGLAFDPTTGRLYASTGGFGGADAIYEVDPATGAASLIGSTGLGNGAIPDIAFTERGVLFAAKSIGGTSMLITIDTDSASGRPIGPIGFQSVSGLAWSVHDTIETVLDIRPGKCPNTLDLRCIDANQHEKLPVAVVGTKDFDPRRIDVTSVRLEGVAPVRSKVVDVTSPPGSRGEDDDDDDGSDDRRGGDDDDDDRDHDRDDDDGDGDRGCPCTEKRKDGRKDVLFYFRSAEVAAALQPAVAGDQRTLTLVGYLEDGRPFRASDCLRLVGRDHDVALTPGSPPRLGVAYPNPFNPVTRIEYELPGRTFVTLSVFDAAGRLVDVLVSGAESAGRHSVEWNARSRASGIYFYRLAAGGRTETRKMILLK